MHDSIQFFIQYIDLIRQQSIMKHYILVDDTPGPQKEPTEKDTEEQTALEKVQRVTSSGLSKLKNTFKKISRDLQYSFAKINHQKKIDRSDKKPSRATMEMIKHIHNGFEPICQSAKRWASQQQASKKQEGERLEDFLETYASQRKQNLQKLARRMTYKLDNDLPEPKFCYGLEDENLSKYQSKFTQLKRKKDELSQKEEEKEQSSSKQQLKSNEIAPFNNIMAISMVRRLDLSNLNSEQSLTQSNNDDKCSESRQTDKIQDNKQKNEPPVEEKDKQASSAKTEEKKADNSQTMALPVISEQQKSGNPFFKQTQGINLKNFIASNRPSQFSSMFSLGQNSLFDTKQQKINVPQQRNIYQYVSPPKQSSNGSNQPIKWSSQPQQLYSGIFSTQTNPKNYGMSYSQPLPQQSQSFDQPINPAQRMSFTAAVPGNNIPCDNEYIKNMFSDRPKQKTTNPSVFGTPKTQKMQRKGNNHNKHKRNKGHDVRVS